MRALITGGCGFLGSNLAREACARGYETWLFDNLSRLGASANLSALTGIGARFAHGDVRNPADVEAVFVASQPDLVFHLAGQVAMTTSIASPLRDFETNALGTMHVLESARRHCPGAPILYSSTNKVYGDLSWVEWSERERRYEAPRFPEGFDESTPFDSQSPYGVSKGAADQATRDYARIFGLKTVVFRHSSIFGEGQFSTYDQGWVGWFIQQALETRADPGRAPFTISGDGKQVRDVLFSSDLVSCYFSAVDAIERARGQVFNIGGGMSNSLSLLELFAFLEAELGVRLRYERLPWRKSDQRVFVADIARAREVFGWAPKIGRDEGLRKMIDWVARVGKAAPAR